MTVRRAIAVISLGMALTLPTATASAQSSRSGMSTDDPLGNVNAMRELSAFGSCIARTRRRVSLALIGAVPGSPEEGQIMRRSITGEQICIVGNTRLSIPDVYTRGVIAEGLLRSEGVPEEYRLAAPAPAEVRDLHGAARCYAVNHLSEVRALLETRLGSPEEVAAVRALWNDFRACMPGFQVRLNAPWIRFLLAEALLRLPPAPPAAGN